MTRAENLCEFLCEPDFKCHIPGIDATSFFCNNSDLQASFEVFGNKILLVG